MSDKEFKEWLKEDFNYGKLGKSEVLKARDYNGRSMPGML